MSFNVAIMGATGAVGQVILEILAERDFPVGELTLLASPRSEGRRIDFKGEPHIVEALDRINDRKEKAIEQNVPWYVRSAFRDFAAAKGTIAYEAFRTGSGSYISCMMEKE